MASVPKDSAITFVGCGKLGSAILEGLVQHANEQLVNVEADDLESKANNLTIKSLIACIHREESYDNLRTKYNGVSLVEVLINENVKGVEKGDLIVLGCKPYNYRDILSEPGISQALAGKIVISLMVGVTTSEIKDAIYCKGPFTDSELQSQCQIVNTIPNTAASVRQSITMLFEEEPPLPSSVTKKAEEFLSCVGKIKRVSAPQAHLFSALASLGASTASFFSIVVDGMATGAVEMGVDREEAIEILATSMRGVADMISNGEQLKAIENRSATPGGATEKGIVHLKDHNVPRLFAEAVQKASAAANKMGDKSFWKK